MRTGRRRCCNRLDFVLYNTTGIPKQDSIKKTETKIRGGCAGSKSRIGPTPILSGLLRSVTGTPKYCTQAHEHQFGFKQLTTIQPTEMAKENLFSFRVVTISWRPSPEGESDVDKHSPNIRNHRIQTPHQKSITNK